MTTQQVLITTDDLAHAQSLLENGQLSEMYDYLASKGDRYSTLAKGVVEGNTVSGKAALEFMEHTAIQQGKAWGEAENQDIRVSMATSYLEALNSTLVDEGGVLQRELEAGEIEEFHDDVFEKSGLGVNAWTLKAPFTLLGEAEAQRYWGEVLESAGHFDKEIALTLSTVERLGDLYLTVQTTAVNQEEIDSTRQDINDWFGKLSNVDAILDITAVTAVATVGYIGDSITDTATTALDSAFATFEAFQNLFDQDGLEEEAFENGTNPDTYDHEVDVSTDFTHGNIEQETSTSEEVAADVQDGNVYNTGNASVNSSTANEGGTWSIANASITEGYQPGRSNLETNQVSNQVSDIWYSPLVSSEPTPAPVTPDPWDLSFIFDFSTDLAEIDPLVLDLDGDGIELTPFADQYLFFDIDNDGSQERTGWVGKDDGMLVHDLNADGQINDITETLSEYYGAEKGTGAIFDSSFAALASLDSNNDGVINASDEAFAELKVWQDANQDGVTDEGELQSLTDLGITELSLADSSDGAFIGGNEVKSNSTYVGANGGSQTLAAVNFIADPNGLSEQVDGTGKRIEVQEGSATYSVGDNNGETVDATDKAVSNIIGGIGNDVVTGNAEDNWLVGSLGEDQLSGGAGNDYLVADAADIEATQANIQGGDGFDIVQFVGDKGVTFNLQASQVEMAIGTDQADHLISGSSSQSIIDGGAGNDVIIGGSADDVLNGEEGSDTLYGHLGDDLIRGQRGDDRLVGGGGEDILQGGLGNDILFGNIGEDLLDGGQGNDYLDGGEGYDVAQYSGSYADYVVEANDDGTYRVTDRRTDSADGIDTLKDIEALNFADINEVRIDGDNPLPVKDSIRVSAEADGRTYRVAMSDLLVNDLDYQEDTLSLTEAFNAKGGTVSIEGDEVVFLLDEGFTGIPTFSYRVQDANGNNGVQVGVTNSTQTAEMSAQVTLILDHHPDDPNFVDQWYLSDINVLPVWQDYTGKGVTVAITEVGPWDGEEYGQIDYSHPDLLPNIDAESLRTQNPNIEPTQHATLVAGVIAAARNDIGSVGVAYDATLISAGISEGDVSALLNWQNYDVVNNSWGPEDQFSHTITNGVGEGFSYTLLENAVTYGRDSLGTIMVMAGGNDRQTGHDTNGSDLTNNRYGITVGAINAEGDLGNLQIASDPFSNPGSSILVSAPGSNITSTSRLVENEQGSTFGGDYETAQGTSFAAPIISGVVALMLEANPNLGWRDVQKILALTAKQIDDPNTEWQTNGATNLNGGGMHFSNDYGFGLVDAEAAVRLAESWSYQNTSANEEEAIYQSGEVNLAIPDDGNELSSTITVTDSIQLESIEVTFDLQHAQMGDVEIVLISPDGTESILVNRPGVAPSGETAGRGQGEFEGTWTTSSTHHWGEDSAGDWTLVLRDKVTGETGTLESWELRLYGEQGSEDDLYVFTSEFNGQINGLQGEIGGIDTINTAALTSNTVINLDGVSHINGHDFSLQISEDEKEALIVEIEAALAETQHSFSMVNSDLAATETQLEAANITLADGIITLGNLYTAVTEKEVIVNQAIANYNAWYESFGRGNELISNGSILLLDNTLDASDPRYIVKTYSAGNLGISEYEADYSAYQNVINIYNNANNDYNSSIDTHNALYSELLAVEESIPLLAAEVAELENQVLTLQQELQVLEDELSSVSSIASNALIENAVSGIGDDQLIGNQADNILSAGRGNDVLTGAEGNDALYGGDGNDTYHYQKGDGNDVIDDFSGSDVLILKDINASEVSISREGNDAVITVNPTGETIRLSNQFLFSVINTITFANDEQWSEEDIAEYASWIRGTEANDTLSGSTGDDHLEGGKG
ncbi:S8 family serine peptidase, partial [Marinomonas transparens]